MFTSVACLRFRTLLFNNYLQNWTYQHIQFIDLSVTSDDELWHSTFLLPRGRNQTSISFDISKQFKALLQQKKYTIPKTRDPVSQAWTNQLVFQVKNTRSELELLLNLVMPLTSNSTYSA
jgi:hypothetical protein